MKKSWISGVAVLALGGAAALATPSYTAVFLPTNGLTSTYATGIASNGQIVGYSKGEPSDALLWGSLTASPIDLNPAEVLGGSEAFAIDGSYQGGAGGPAGAYSQAVIWNGSPNNYVDLQPPGFIASSVRAMSGTQQVGGGELAEGTFNALLWTGTAGSVINLTPTGYTSADAYGTNGSQQVGIGFTTINGQPSGSRAMLWNGGAASALDITPAGYSDATAWAISGNLVAGSGSPGTGQTDALLWNISTGIYTDLGPGEAYAIAGNYEAGYNGNDAMLWTGSASSAIDLQSFLPTGYAYSVAYGVDTEGDVVGAAGAYGQWQAVVWLAPEPATVSGAIVFTLALTQRKRNAG